MFSNYTFLNSDQAVTNNRRDPTDRYREVDNGLSNGIKMEVVAPPFPELGIDPAPNY
jgi:hypothetical protein